MKIRKNYTLKVGFVLGLLLGINHTIQAQNNGTISGSGAYSADVPAVFSSNTYSVNLAGTKKISFQSPQYLNSSTGGAISIWIKLPAFTGGTFGDPVFGFNSSSTPVITIANSTSIKIKSYIAEETIFTVPQMNTNTWYNIIVNRIAGGATHVYLNGTESMTGAIMHSGDYIIDELGDWWQYGQYFSGKICELKKFDNPLSGSDISNLASGLMPASSSVLHWKVNEGNGITVLDTQAGGNSSGCGTGDCDAQAFLNAAGITDVTQKNAVNQLVLDLKSAGLWTKMKAIYPFVGSISETQKWNLKDPRDLDAAFRLTFTGTTHSSSGLNCAGSGYANTHCLPISGFGSINNSHFSIYSRTSSAGNIDIGSAEGAGFEIYSRYSDDNSYMDITSGNRVITPNTDAKGFYLITRTNANLVTGYKNGISIGTNTATETNTLSNYSFYIGARNENGSADQFSLREYAFASIGDGLSSTEVSAFNTAINAYLNNLVNVSNLPPPSSSSQWITTTGNNIYYNTGKVGIGTGAAHMTDPNFNLFVSKGIRTEKLKVDIPYTSWPDYVFDKNYKLSSPEETERFIKLNQHLPGIPSAVELVKNGLDVGANQALLLKKIEELTLIIIQQNKRIKALEKRLNK